MADLSKVKIGSITYNLKDAEARVSIATLTADLTSEVTRAKAAEATLTASITTEATNRADADTALSNRIEALEGRGRFLSAYNVATGFPTTYPDIPSTATTTYTYTFKSGDYYIVGSVPASGTKYMPSGASITATKSGDTWTWEVGKAVTTNEIGVGDYFLYDGTKWVWVQNSTKTVSFANIAGEPDDNANLKDALDELREGKVDKTQTIAGIDLQDNISTEELQTALELGNLAYADTASGSVSYTPAGTIGEINVTAAGTITVNDLTQTSTAATLTKADYTPSGSIKLDNAAQATGNKVLKAGSISVTVKDASAATEAVLTTITYTPTGTITAKETEGSFSALTGATFVKNDDNGVQIEGTVSAPSITVNDDTVDTFIKTLTDGTVDAASIDTSKFDGGSFTGATAASFTQGAKASFTQGTKASFDKGTAVSAAIEGLVATVGEEGTADAETLIFTAAATDNVIGHDEATFTPNGNDSFTANGDDSFTANEVGTFTGATINTGFFSAHKLPVAGTTATAVTAVTAELASAPVFTGAKYNLTTARDTALKSVEFTATNSANIVNKVEYLKQEINTATFTGTEAELSFEGSKLTDALVTAVNYDRATANGATFNAEEKKVTPQFTGTAATISVTVSPDAE